MRAVIFVCLTLMCMPLAAQKKATAPAPSAAAKAAVASSDDASIRAAQAAIADPFFAHVLAGEYSAGLVGLKQVFAVAETKREYLVEQLQSLEKKLGKAVSYERLGQRRLPGSKRVMAVYYASYHPLKPAIWELVFYAAPAVDGGKDRWVLTSMRFETESIFATLEGVTP